MARETKAQREAREQAENEARLAVELESYPIRLMAVLERARKVNFELEVRDGLFWVKDRDNREDSFFSLSYHYGNRTNNVLEELEWTVERKEAEEREVQRRYMLRQQALAKLTKEEREELGL